MFFVNHPVVSVFCFILFLLLLPCSFAEDKDITMIVSNPSYELLNELVYLHNTKRFPFPDKIIGLYHEDDSDKFEKAELFVKEQKLDISFVKLQGDVGVEGLFGLNRWTETFHKLFSGSDAILFPGGPDIPPVIYGKKTNLMTGITTPKRHYYEVSFLFHLLGGSQNPNFEPFLSQKPSYPIMAICLGVQTMNVATGGTLYQDIPSEVYGLSYIEDVLKLPSEQQHKNYNLLLSNDSRVYYGNLHPIVLKKNSPLRTNGEITEMPLVLSIHHQAIENLGLNLDVWATSVDGKIVEAVSHKKFPHVLGVQFHPEKRKLWDVGTSLKKEVSSRQNVAETFCTSKSSVLFNELVWKTFAGYIQEAKK